MKLTAANVRTLNALVKGKHTPGGLYYGELHMGRLSKHGGARKTDITNLVNKGLAEWTVLEDKAHGPERDQLCPEFVVLTAAGREALVRTRAAKAVKQLPKGAKVGETLRVAVSKDLVLVVGLRVCGILSLNRVSSTHRSLNDAVARVNKLLGTPVAA